MILTLKKKMLNIYKHWLTWLVICMTVAFVLGDGFCAAVASVGLLSDDAL